MNYEALPVKFIVTDTTGYELKSKEDFQKYYDNMKKLKGGQQCSQEYYYKGVRIKTKNGENYDLHVQDTRIVNIAKLINDKYYKTNPIVEPRTDSEKSWFRLYRFAKLIYDNILSQESYLIMNGKDNAIRMIIICLKSFGDSFQVYYSTMIQNYSKSQEPPINTYLSSSDKNTGAEKLLYNSPFLLNGCGIVPYQEMRQRFASFFNDDLVTQLEDRGDIGNGNYDNYNFGSMKAILTNIEQTGRDYTQSIMMLVNNITSLYGKLQQEVKLEIIDELKKLNETLPTSSMDVAPASVSSEIDSLLGSVINLYRNGSIDKNAAKEINDKLQKIYNTLKILVETDNQLDNKINEIGQIIEEQNKALIKMIELKRDPTTQEYQNIIDKLEKQPPDNTIQAKLQKFVESNVSRAEIFGSKINEFCDKVSSKIKNIKTNIKGLLEKNKPTSDSRRSSRPNSYGSVMEMIINKLKTTTESTSRGGKRTIKHKRIRRKKQTIKNTSHRKRCYK
jgi:hypothetical protein